MFILPGLEPGTFGLQGTALPGCLPYKVKNLFLDHMLC